MLRAAWFLTLFVGDCSGHVIHYKSNVSYLYANIKTLYHVGLRNAVLLNNLFHLFEILEFPQLEITFTFYRTAKHRHLQCGPNMVRKIIMSVVYFCCRYLGKTKIPKFETFALMLWLSLRENTGSVTWTFSEKYFCELHSVWTDIQNHYINFKNNFEFRTFYDHINNTFWNIVLQGVFHPTGKIYFFLIWVYIRTARPTSFWVEKNGKYSVVF